MIAELFFLIFAITFVCAIVLAYVWAWVQFIKFARAGDFMSIALLFLIALLSLIFFVILSLAGK